MLLLLLVVATKAVATLCDIVAVLAKNMIPMIFATLVDDAEDLFIVVFGFSLWCTRSILDSKNSTVHDGDG